MDLKKTFNTQPLILTDAGLETDMAFNRGFELPAFAAHSLLSHDNGRLALEEYYCLFLELACEMGATFILDAPTWRAQPHYAKELGSTLAELQVINQEAVNFIDEIRSNYRRHAVTSILNGLIGPRGDGYTTSNIMTPNEADNYHYQQMCWLAETQVDMVTAMTFTNSAEAIGVVWAAQRANLPIAVSFTLETDGRLPSGETLEDAIAATDQATSEGALHFMINCVHPDHLHNAFAYRGIVKRIRGVRCNASRKSHAELDCSTVLDRGDCNELAALYTHLKVRMPWLSIWGGCCGTDISHVASIAHAIKPFSRSPC